METFQYMVMMISLVILIISLIIIGLTLRRQKYNSTYPPVVANCPDYWSDTAGNNGSVCKNDSTTPLGNPSCAPEMDFSTANWQGNPGLCAKYKWAKSCNMPWDGISNNPDLCET